MVYAAIPGATSICSKRPIHNVIRLRCILEILIFFLIKYCVFSVRNTAPTLLKRLTSCFPVVPLAVSPLFTIFHITQQSSHSTLNQQIPFSPKRAIFATTLEQPPKAFLCYKLANNWDSAVPAVQVPGFLSGSECRKLVCVVKTHRMVILHCILLHSQHSYQG